MQHNNVNSSTIPNLALCNITRSHSIALYNSDDHVASRYVTEMCECGRHKSTTYVFLLYIIFIYINVIVNG